MERTNYEEVFELAKNILREDERMLLITDELSKNLKQLQASFLDDGIDEVNGFVNTILAKLNNAQDAFMVTADELEKYAKLLAAGKGKTV